MNETNQTEQKKAPKKLIAIIVAVVVLIGGGIAAAMMISSSPKTAYFKAEKDSYNFIVEQLKDKYALELEWYEKMLEEATESKIDISANYNVPSTGSFGMDPAQIVNNSTISVLTQSDMENKEASVGLSANVAGITIEGLNLFLTEDDLFLETPFIDELLQVQDEDIATLLAELDPASFEGIEPIDFADFFEKQGSPFSEEDIEYLQEEYLEFIFDELPEDNFTSSDETIEVNEESIKAEKIEMALSEDETKEIFVTVFDKMKEDERLKEIIKEQLTYSQFGDSLAETEIDDMLNEFETGLEDAKNAINELHIPNGINSTIWINDGLIVERDFSVEIGPSPDELVSLSITGSQLLTTASQWFDYNFSFNDGFNEDSLQLAGELTWEDNQADDTVTITVADAVIAYEATESLEDGNRDFDRKLSANIAGEDFALYWNGTSSYDNDQMDSEHTLSVETIDMPKDTVGLQLNIEGKVIDGVDMPEDGNVRNIGKMSLDELNNYFETEFLPALEEWGYQLLMGGGATGF